MKDFLLLKFLDLFQGLFEKSQIDYKAMRTIIQFKLLMDSRNSTNLAYTKFGKNRSNSRRGKKEKNKSIYLLIGYFLMGFVFSFIISMPLKLTVIIGLLTTLFFLFVGTLIISNYSTILLNTRDKNNILTKPITNKTLATARLIHLIYYIGLLSIAFMLVPIIAIGIKFSYIAALTLFIEILFLDIFIIAIVTILYAIILRYFDGEKLKDVVNIVQIVLGIVMFLFTQVAYDFTGYLVKLNELKFHWWNLIIPSFWFQAPFNLLEGNREFQYIIGTILAIIIPIGLSTLCKVLMPSFEKNIQKLDSVSRGKIKKEKGIKAILDRLICRNREEKAFFDFGLEMIKNERELKLKLYPLIGKSLLLPIVFIFIFGQHQSISQIRSSNWMFLIFYFATTFLVSYIYFVRYSANYKASWIYFVTPIEEKRNCYNGVLKAYMIRLICPSLLFLSIVMIGIFGIRIIPELIGYLLITIALIPISYKIQFNDALPFTVAFSDKKMGNGIARIGIMILLVIIAAIEFSIDSFLPFGAIIFMVLAFIFTIFSWKFLFKKRII